MLLPIHEQMASYLVEQYFATKNNKINHQQVLDKVKIFTKRLTEDNTMHYDVALQALSPILLDQINITEQINNLENAKRTLLLAQVFPNLETKKDVSSFLFKTFAEIKSEITSDSNLETRYHQLSVAMSE